MYLSEQRCKGSFDCAAALRFGKADPPLRMTAYEFT